MKRFTLAILLALSAWGLTPTCHAQDSLEKGLLKQAPRLIKYFQEHGYQNIGVLKFLVSREGKGFTDNIGTFNMLAARRLERALILANDPRSPVGIVDNASDVARNIPGANHLSTEGRQKLFSEKYPLAWGKDTVQPDAFVTGTSEISADRRKLTMTLYGFDRATAKLVHLGEDFQVANATERLTEMGESFMLRGLFDSDTTQSVAKKEAKVYEEAVNVYEQKTVHPVKQTGQPVTLEILYGGKKIPFEVKGGKAFIPEPTMGQSVEFALSRDRNKERYGVVLKVNGENTLDKERRPDISCRQWVLDPGQGPWLIQGFQVGNSAREIFRVASLVESKQREISYGRDVGTITMTVFREQKAKDRPQLANEDQQYQTVVRNLGEVRDHPKNYLALKAQLLDDANRGGSRGLILPGRREKSTVQTVSFIADPTPVMGVTIVYYKK